MDGRVMYFLPWNGVLIAGTTEETMEKSVHDPIPNPSKIKEIVQNFKDTFDKAEVHIQSSWGGIRPLIKDTKQHSSDKISRVHLIEVDETSGLVSAMGGKWTIFRKMGEEAVDQVLLQLKNMKAISENEFEERRKLSTKSVKLIGAPNSPLSSPKIAQSNSDN